MSSGGAINADRASVLDGRGAAEAGATSDPSTDLAIVDAPGGSAALHAASTNLAAAALRTTAATFELALGANQLAMANASFVAAATSASSAVMTCGAMLLPLGGFPRFHAGRLPGAPADAMFVEIEGVHVRYRDAGRGPAVVLVHGYGASSDSWASVIPALARDHRVIAVDLKGFGWTSRPAGDYSPAAQAALVWAVLDELGVADVAIVGHSWGSSVSLAMAVAQPARVRRVALYAAYVYDDQVPRLFRWAERPGLGELLFGLYYRIRIEDRAALAFFDDRWVTRTKVDRLAGELARPGTVAAALATARRHHFGLLHHHLRTFTRPILLLWGEDDQVTPLRFGRRLVGELANARLEIYPRCGHLPMVEAHARSTRDLAAFLAADLAPTPTSPRGPELAPTGDAGEPGGRSAESIASGEQPDLAPGAAS